MGRKAVKKKAKVVTEDPMVEVVTKELSILGSTKPWSLVLHHT